jgi:hypothetical protein
MDGCKEAAAKSILLVSCSCFSSNPSVIVTLTFRVILVSRDHFVLQAINIRIEVESYVYRLRRGFTRDGRATFRQIVFADEEVGSKWVVFLYINDSLRCRL